MWEQRPEPARRARSRYGVPDDAWPCVRARTANAVAASLMNLPTSDAGSRCLFTDDADQLPGNRDVGRIDERLETSELDVCESHCRGFIKAYNFNGYS